MACSGTGLLKSEKSSFVTVQSVQEVHLCSIILFIWRSQCEHSLSNDLLNNFFLVACNMIIVCFQCWMMSVNKQTKSEYVYVDLGSCNV
jgi:hypothetical protein